MAAASEVQVLETTFVKPSEATPGDGLWVSPLDLEMAHAGHTPTVYLYSATGAADFFDVARIKASLAKALAAFYPLAGRLGADESGRIQISCTGEGVLFVVARADGVTLADIKDVKPSPELTRQFVPRVEPRTLMLAIQVTFLKCGGVALGTSLHHISIDAPSAFHFFSTWSAISRDGDGAVLEPPCHDRTLLRARSPPRVHPDALSTFYPRLIFSGPARPAVSEVFVVSKGQVAALRRVSGGTSTFCAVAALVWQCACAARRLPPDSEARLTFPGNVRRRISPPLPDRYFGNALIVLSVAGPARGVTEAGLDAVAGRIRGAIRRLDDELVRSAIDYFELDDEERVPMKGALAESNLQIISWLGMPMYDADFGWGGPLHMSRAESVRGGFVYLMNDGPTEDDGVRVLMCMEAENMEALARVLNEKLRCVEEEAAANLVVKQQEAQAAKNTTPTPTPIKEPERVLYPAELPAAS
ncbi:hypothetical protein U9M48_020257 [Paspalum notatum var. saurae]|uniref:Uncharacterized protein n=1 Tax=Paspalum notatum var. saurae TaxID=547442 RepID=A0AAQ3TFQ4_PASNO